MDTDAINICRPFVPDHSLMAFIRLPRLHTTSIRPVDSAFVLDRFAAVISIRAAYHPRFSPGLFASASSSDEFLYSYISTRYPHLLTFLHVQPLGANAPTIASADVLMDIPMPHDAGSTEATIRISPSIVQSPSRLCLSDLRHGVPCKYWALLITVNLPHHDALYPLAVRQASVLPSVSFRFAVTHDTLAFQLTLPLAGE